MTETTVDAAALLTNLMTLPADRRLGHLRSVGEPEPLILALSEETYRQATSDVGRALAASDMIVALADEVQSPAARTNSRSTLAMVMAYASRFEDALAVAEHAVAIGGAAGLHVEAARARLAGVHPLARLGRYAEAIAAGEVARAALIEAGESVLAARADVSLGSVYGERDDPVSALVHLDRARSGLVGDPVALAQVEVNRGNALMSLDEFVAAEAAFRSSVDAFTFADLDWATAIAEGNLAYLATRQGRLERALHHFERARRALEEDESPADLARLLAEQADALALLGLPADALAIYERVLPDLESTGLAAETAQAQFGRGRALLRIGDLSEARSALDLAAATFGTLGMAAARARVDVLRAEVAAADDRSDLARILLSEALEVLRERPAEAAVARYQLARLALTGGDLATAEAELATALETAESLDLAPVLADLLHARALLHRARGESVPALADLRAAVAQVERVRGTLQAERFRAAYLGNRLALYEDFVTAALDRGDASIAEAFATVERAKSRALLDLVGGALDLATVAERESGDPTEAALLTELARLRNELNWLYSGLGHEADGEGIGRSGSAATWQSAIHDRERELDAFEDRIAVARGVAGLYAPTLDLAGALAALPTGAALVEYFVAGRELVAFVLRDGQVRVVRHLTDPDNLGRRVRRLHFQLGRPLAAGERARAGPRAERQLVDVRRELGALDALLLAPLGDALSGVDRLLIVPHGALHTLPFHALWDGERHLIERCEVVYAPSASVLAHLTSTAPPADGADALVVGVPDAAAPRIAAEAVRVAQVLGTDHLLLGEAATVERVTAAAGTADVVHLACHGRFAPESPLGSGIRLADGWLTARDVYTLKLRASLVTLSGCETGRTAVGSGDELVGLVRGFFAAGASSLILSLWIVNDESTAELMAGFYDAWRRGQTKPAALRAAQRDVLARRPHPAFWAPFILGGQP